MSRRSSCFFSSALAKRAISDPVTSVPANAGLEGVEFLLEPATTAAAAPAATAAPTGTAAAATPPFVAAGAPGFEGLAGDPAAGVLVPLGAALAAVRLEDSGGLSFMGDDF